MDEKGHRSSHLCRSAGGRVHRAVLDDVEDATEPGARGARIFPYHQVTVVVAATFPLDDVAAAYERFAEGGKLEKQTRTIYSTEWGPMITDLVGIPRVELVPHGLQVPSKHLPPPGTGLAPGRGPLGWLRDSVMRRQHMRSYEIGMAACRASRVSLGLPPEGPPVATLVRLAPELRQRRVSAQPVKRTVAQQPYRKHSPAFPTLRD